MNPRELKIVSALAVFLTAALPAAAGTIAFRAQPVLIAAIKSEGAALPALTSLYFNHFNGTLGALFVLALGGTWVAIRGYRQAEDTTRLATLLATTCFSALLSVFFLTLLVLATALPLYAKLTVR